jgi:hypothetical protein
LATASAKRRGHGEDSIYFDSDKNRYVGAVSVGFGSDGKWWMSGWSVDSSR